MSHLAGQFLRTQVLLCNGTRHEAVVVFSTNPIILSESSWTLAALMSYTHPISTVSSSSNFQLIFNNALKAYGKRTKKDLLAHPLATELENCDSPSEILAVLRKQGFDQSLSDDDRWTKWLDPTVNVLFMLSKALGEGIGLVSFKI